MSSPISSRSNSSPPVTTPSHNENIFEGIAVAAGAIERRVHELRILMERNEATITFNEETMDQLNRRGVKRTYSSAIVPDVDRPASPFLPDSLPDNTTIDDDVTFLGSLEGDESETEQLVPDEDALLIYDGDATSDDTMSSSAPSTPDLQESLVDSSDEEF